MSFNEWKSIKLGDIVDISSSKRIFAKEYVSEGIPFYRGKEIIEKSKGDKVSNELFISRDRYTEIKDKFGVPKTGDILLTSVGTLGIPYLVEEEEFYFKDGNLTWFKNFSSKCDNKFIYFWLQSIFCKNQIYAKAIGSTQKALTIETLKNFDVLLPPLKEQKAIVDILSSLDDKIELNNQMNQMLEEMAQALFKRWFVDFEFPNKEGQPYKSSGGEMVESELGMIPKGWEVKKLEDICLFNKFSLNKKDKILNISYLDTSNITQNKIDSIQKLVVGQDKIPSRAKRKIRNNSIVYSTVRPNQLHYGILKNPNSNLIVSTGFVVIDETENYHCNDLIYYYLTQTIITEKLQAIGETSTSTYPSIKASDIQSLQILLPKDMDLLNKLCDTLGSINDKINQNNEEGKVIQELRDILLPKLMSGEIRVSDLC